MSNYYISKKTVESAVEYFSGIDYTGDNITLDMYWIFKRCGVSTSHAIDTGDKDVRSEIFQSLWAYAGLFSRDEVGGKRTLMFPDKIGAFRRGTTKNPYYSAGSAFKQQASRAVDSVRNMNPSIFKKVNGVLTLDPDYDTRIANDILKGKKFSLFFFAVWINRFTAYPIDSDHVTEKEVQRILQKSIVSFLRLDKADLAEFFEDDFSEQSIEVSDVPLSGEDLRSILFSSHGFPLEGEPEILDGTEGIKHVELKSLTPTLEQLKRYILPTGKNPSPSQIKQTLELKKQAILTGVPGTGKSRFIDEERKKFDYSTLIQFHPSFTYEQFIGGETLVNGNVETKPGIFFKAIQNAESHPNEKHLFVIDEINRGNIAEIFGETIQILDRKNYFAVLPNSINGIDRISLPDNLYILGAMNSSDKSIALLDLAIRRRFAFIELTPNYEVVSDQVRYGAIDVGRFLETVNTRIMRVLGDSSKLLGQGYVFPQTQSQDGTWTWSEEEFHLQFNYVILPTLKEYAQENDSILTGIVGSELSNGILDSSEFKDAFAREFG